MEDCTLGFDHLPGEIDLSERGKQDEHGLWSSDELVEVEVEDDINVCVSHRKDGAEISLSAHHIENEETKRAFHVGIDWKAEWREVRELRDFLSLLLAWHEQEKQHD